MNNEGHGIVEYIMILAVLIVFLLIFREQAVQFVAGIVRLLRAGMEVIWLWYGLQ